MDEIDLKYKMLFTHRLDANRARFWSTVLLLGLAFLCLLIEFGITWFSISVIGIIYAIVAIIFRYTLLDKIGKKRIATQCDELIKLETK